MQIRFVGINSHAGCPRLLHAAANTDNVTVNLQLLCQHHSNCLPLSLTTHIFPTLPSFLSPSLQSSLSNSVEVVQTGVCGGLSGVVCCWAV